MLPHESRTIPTELENQGNERVDDNPPVGQVSCVTGRSLSGERR